jgi:hypothetical protein
VRQEQWPTWKQDIKNNICYHTPFWRDLVLWGSKHSEYSISRYKNNHKALHVVTLFGGCIRHSDRLGKWIFGSIFVTTHFLK